MTTILIKADKQSSKILSELAKKLGGNVINFKDDQFEDLMLGTRMNKVKTGKTISKDLIIFIKPSHSHHTQSSIRYRICL